MITRIREVRKAKRLTLEEVAARCDPPTTAQTIGRLETGMRTVSVKWLNRIAAALGVQASDLVDLPGSDSIAVAALLGPDGVAAPSRPTHFIAPAIGGQMVGVSVLASIGDYRKGDQLWCETLTPDRFIKALNKDILVPRSGGRFLFGTLIGAEAGKLLVLPPGFGARQQVVTDPPWVAIAVQLIRSL